MQFSLPLSDAPSSPETPSSPLAQFWKSLELEAIELEQPLNADPTSTAPLPNETQNEDIGREHGFRLRRYKAVLRLCLARASTSQGDVWNALDELEALGVNWDNMFVRRLWFCAPLRLRVSPNVWRAFVRSGSSREIRWRRSHSEAWIRLLLPCNRQNTLGTLRGRRLEMSSRTAQIARDALTTNEWLPVRSLEAEPPMWLRAATTEDFAQMWRELALELELWPSVLMRPLVARPSLPDHELRDWEKAPQDAREETPRAASRHKVA